MAILYISHDLSLVRHISDRVAVMYAGRLVETGPADQVFASPQHPYTRGLVGAIPSIGQERGRLIAIDGYVPELVDPEPGCRFAGRCPYRAPVCGRVDPSLVAIAPHRSVACHAFGSPPAGIPAEELPTVPRS
jgi:oligopeptide/dipeptide ABC transporter ATP-binding protein